MKKNLITAISILLVLIGTVSIKAQDAAAHKIGNGNPAPMHEMQKCEGMMNGDLDKMPMPGSPVRGKGIIQKLKLSDEQTKKIGELRNQHQKDAVDLKAKIAKNRIDLRSIIQQGNIDEKKILDLTDENSKLQGELKKAGVKHWFAVYKLLDKEQQLIWSKTFGQMGNANVMKERMKERAKNMRMNREERQPRQPMNK